MNVSYNKLQEEFMVALGQPRFFLSDVINAYAKGYCNVPIIDHNIKLWKGLIEEEVVKELFVHIDGLRSGGAASKEQAKAYLTHIADDIADAVYVLSGLANCLSIPLEHIYAAVHAANMNKRIKQENGDYTIVKRADGKILKPEGWKPADIEGIVNATIKREEDEAQPYSYFLLQARQTLKDHELGLMIDQRDYEKAIQTIAAACTDLIKAMAAVIKLQDIRKALDAYEPTGSPGSAEGSKPA